MVMFEVGWSRSCRDESQELQSEKTWNEGYRKNRITEIRDNGNTRITGIEVGYLSKPEGNVDMGTKWAIKRDTIIDELHPLLFYYSYLVKFTVIYYEYYFNYFDKSINQLIYFALVINWRNIIILKLKKLLPGTWWLSFQYFINCRILEALKPFTIIVE